MKHEAAEVAASAPPVAVAAWTFLDHPVAEWVQVFALIWILVQMGWFIYSKIILRNRNGEDRSD